MGIIICQHKLIINLHGMVQAAVLAVVVVVWKCSVGSYIPSTSGGPVYAILCLRPSVFLSANLIVSLTNLGVEKLIGEEREIDQAVALSLYPSDENFEV